MIHLDGSEGEGGGQILRSALALALVTGRPFVIDHIRAGRAKPGLQRQHLTAVLAAAEIGAAKLRGAELGSQSLSFVPQRNQGGEYRFAIATAGSAMLVLQTVLPALLCAAEPSALELMGGTHNPMAPTFDFLNCTYAPLLARMGADFELILQRHGFYPAGGGEVFAEIRPANWCRLDLLARSHEAKVRRARILIANLARSIAAREASVLCERFALDRDQVQIEMVASPGPGNVIQVEVDLGEVLEVVTAFGERGVVAEDVAGDAADQAQALIASGVSVGEYLADQLLLPMALAGGGAFRSVKPSSHTLTNAQVIERFLDVHIDMRAEEAVPATSLVTVSPRA